MLRRLNGSKERSASAEAQLDIENRLGQVQTQKGKRYNQKLH